MAMLCKLLEHALLYISASGSESDGEDAVQARAAAEAVLVVVVKTFRGLLCILSDVPRIHRCTLGDFRSGTRGAIFVLLPREVGRLISNGIRKHLGDLVTVYEPLSGAEATLGSRLCGSEKSIDKL